jgi:hypothetical protein
MNKTMKKIYSILTLLLLTTSVFLTLEATAQAPQKMSYQSVLRNSCARCSALQYTNFYTYNSVHQQSIAAVYVETQTATTSMHFIGFFCML